VPKANAQTASAAKGGRIRIIGCASKYVSAKLTRLARTSGLERVGIGSIERPRFRGNRMTSAAGIGAFGQEGPLRRLRRAGLRTLGQEPTVAIGNGRSAHRPAIRRWLGELVNSTLRGLQDRVYERMGSARKRSSADGYAAVVRRRSQRATRSSPLRRASRGPPARLSGRGAPRWGFLSTPLLNLVHPDEDGCEGGNWAQAEGRFRQSRCRDARCAAVFRLRWLTGCWPRRSRMVTSWRRCVRRSVHPGCFDAAASIGILRKRLPVAAKIALATAGTIAEVPGSPIPPGSSELWMIWTSIAGASLMRSIW
jgi:hypothetical protein